MTSGRQIERHEVRVGVSPGTEIDSGPFRLGQWRVKHPANHQTSGRPAGNSAPTFDAHQQDDLLMHREGMMRSGHMHAYPDTDVSERIKASRLRMSFVLI